MHYHFGSYFLKKKMKNYITLNTNCFHNLTQKRGLKNSHTPKDYKNLRRKKPNEYKKDHCNGDRFLDFRVRSMKHMLTLSDMSLNLDEDPPSVDITREAKQIQPRRPFELGRWEDGI